MVEMVKLGKMIQTDKWDSELLREIGRAVIAHAQLCHQLYLAPKRLKKISLEEWEKIGKEEVRVPDRCTDIRREYLAIHGTVPPDLDRLLNEVREVHDRRNNLIHAFWGVSKSKDGEQKIVARHQIRDGVDHGASLDAIATLVKDLKKVRNSVGRYSWPEFPAL